jgi:mannose/cellobiose epimerase-like protein (N-acyl-D-glucosamine 2-epimerase family)
MKKAVWVVVVLLVVAVDWAALHDILLGSEPSHTQEWTWLVVSTLALAGAAWLALRRRTGQRASQG